MTGAGTVTHGADEVVETQRPSLRLLGDLEAVGDVDAGVCVDGVCVIPLAAGRGVPRGT